MEIENLHNAASFKENVSTIKIFPQIEFQAIIALFHFYQIFWREISYILNKVSQGAAWWDQYNLEAKHDKDMTRKENHKMILYMNKCTKILNKY